jgi:hypothetical protein
MRTQEHMTEEATQSKAAACQHRRRVMRAEFGGWMHGLDRGLIFFVFLMVKFPVSGYGPHVWVQGVGNSGEDGGVFTCYASVRLTYHESCLTL